MTQLSPPHSEAAAQAAAIAPPDFKGSVVQLLLGTEGGGIITAIQQWAPLLIEAGWSMHFVLLTESKAAEMLRSVGLTTTIVPMSRLGRLTRLHRELSEFNPAILHCHNPSSHLMAMAARRKLDARVVRTVHADMFHEMRGTQPGWKIWLWKQTMQRILRRTDLLTVVSPHLISLLPGIRGDEPFLKVMPNGFDPASIDQNTSQLPSELQNWIGDAPVVLAMGRLVAVKNFAMLLRAWQRVAAERPDARLLLAGSGPQEATLRKLAIDLEIEQSVRLIGWIDAVAPYLHRAAVIAISSRSECCPMLVFEAMAARKPIVATQVGGVPHLVTDDQEGLLTADDDAPVFATALIRLLNHPDQAQRLGDAGRATLERRFEHRIVAAQLADAYLSIAPRR